MDSTKLFQEKQYFRQWWLWIILFSIDVLTIFLFLRYIFDSSIIDRTLASMLLRATPVILSLLLTVLFTCMHLDTIVNEEGISLRFFPIHLCFKKYNWNILHQANIRTYNALSEYGGWGIRYSFSKKGVAYTISGNTGLQLELRDGKKILIGTQKPTELVGILQNHLQLLKKI